tara:strand:- start:275 stop:535 length:261 start_codon:yes stop_codon:yes gene_type:complete
MKNLFDRRRPNGAKVREIKDLVINYFGFPETTVLTVAELRCHDDGCPPVETVITARHSDSSIQDWRLTKPIDEIAKKDIESLCTKH